MFLKVQPGDTGREFESEGTVGHSPFSFIPRSEERGLPLPWAHNMLYPPQHRSKAVGLADKDRNLQPWEPTRSFTFCASYDSIALIKHHEQKQFGERRNYLDILFSIMSVRHGSTQAWRLEQLIACILNCT